jgi:hypothetical protein
MLTYKYIRKLSSHDVAWTYSKGAKGFAQHDPPVHDMFWSTATLEGCTTMIHIDTGGFGTSTDVYVGSKYWILGEPKESIHSIHTFGNKWHPMYGNVGKMSYEGILLSPGSIL